MTGNSVRGSEAQEKTGWDLEEGESRRLQDWKSWRPTHLCLLGKWYEVNKHRVMRDREEKGANRTSGRMCRIPGRSYSLYRTGAFAESGN